MAALNPNNKNASLRHKRDRSSLARLNMAFVLENLGDLCAISMRNTATCDQLIERLKNNCAYWKANDRDAKILVDQFLTIGQRQNLCHPVAGRSQTWTVGPSSLQILERRTVRRKTPNQQNSNVFNNIDGNKVSSRKNSPVNPKSVLPTDTRATYSDGSPIELHAPAVYASPVCLTEDHYSPVPPPAPVQPEELSLPPVEESASVFSKCQRCGGRCEHSLVELYKKAEHFSYDLACFKPMFEQILIRRKLSEQTATTSESKSRNICVECNRRSSRPPPGYRIKKNYNLDELLNMLAELNRRRMLTKTDIEAVKEKPHAPTCDHNFHKKCHREKFILTPHAIIPVTRQAEIELMQSPAGINRCSKKKEISWSGKRQRIDKTQNCLKTAKSTLESSNSIVVNNYDVGEKPCSKYVDSTKSSETGQICHL